MYSKSMKSILERHTQTDRQTYRQTDDILSLLWHNQKRLAVDKVIATINNLTF